MIEEYRRFLYLAVTTRGGATPSKAVDEAWHLHLNFTKSYWDDLCKGVLGKPLHHTPGDGSPGDEAHFGGQYARTLARYRSVFGRTAPADIWPSGCTARVGEPATELPEAMARAVRASLTEELKAKPVRRTGFISALVALVIAGGLALAAITQLPTNKPGAGILLLISVMILLMRFGSGNKRRGNGNGSGGGCSSFSFGSCGSSCGGGGCGGGCG